jgi:formyltetrahydrofolate deformylase
MTKETKAEQEDRLLSLLYERGVDVVVLARYVQVLRAQVRRCLSERDHQHPPLLPPGLRRYEALPPDPREGVKTIGATAQYVTEGLDAGPITHQDASHATHRDTVDDLVRLGREVERVVLARAVRFHLEDRVLVDGNRTVVFE